VPRQIAAAADEVAALAEELAAAGNPNLLGDAKVAALIATAASAAAGVLVDLNVAAG
jgi:formiminotetrahydrofolate cyclodeaminase